MAFTHSVVNLFLVVTLVTAVAACCLGAAMATTQLCGLLWRSHVLFLTVGRLTLGLYVSILASCMPSMMTVQSLGSAGAP